MTASPFGRLLTAMVTPMTPDGALDPVGAASIVEHLLAAGHDGIVVNVDMKTGRPGHFPIISSTPIAQEIDLRIYF